MASTSSSVTASPSPTQGWAYDVFLSFRGPDTRHTFIDFFYESLERKGIRTFKDDNRLEKGDCISPSLLKAIKESQFLIAVFSKGYASSKWCLEELATMMECHEKFKNQIVVPIFYHVEPSDVRNQKGSFEDSFKELVEKIGKDDEEKVRRWKVALKKAGELKGHHLMNDYNGFEATCAEKVAADIDARLNHASLAFEKNLVGLESRVNNIINWLRLASDDDDADARFIGICGMGGIGKTTTARVVFNRFSHQFYGACFLADVRQHNAIDELQKTLLTKILKEKSEVEISNVDEGKAMIVKRLKGKKVLIVLDDVDDQLKQLDELAGGRDWFGRGSRVIITTRDAGVLRSHGVDEKYIYHVDTLEKQEAIQLFSLHAFKNESKTGMEELCGSVVRYCEGLPLALKVLGSHLCGKNAVNRKTILKKLEDANSPHTPKDKILKVLKISFDGLDPENKNVFLDITCFFRKWREEYVKGVLDSDLCELIEKSLISVQNGRIEMHDRIQEMGRYIASQEKPWRLWQLKDAVNVLSGKMDHKDIEGISWSTCFSHVSGLGHRPVKISFREMINLKMFKVDGYGNDFHVTDNDLPNSLRWLQIKYYRFASLPESFASSELVGLSLQHSSLQNWKITQKLDKLTLLDLSWSTSLLETPDFDWMPNLRKLNLGCCMNLKVVHPSIGNLSKLVLLDLSRCSDLESLPSFNQVSSLNSLDLCGCIELKNFPEIKERMPYLVELELREVGIIELHSSIQQLQGLTKLYLDDCEHLVCLSNGFCELKNLVELTLRKVGIIELPSSIQQLQGLTKLYLDKCEHLVCLSNGFCELKNLVELKLRKVGIIELPSSIQQLQCLTKLYLDDCEHLVCLSNGFCELKNLKVLMINSCTNLKSLPENLQSLNSLEYLNLNKSYFDSYPESFNQLTRLQHLDIRNCENFRKLPKLPETICQLYADSCFSYRRDIDELVDFPELQSVAFSSSSKRSWYDFAEMCIHFPSRRKTHFSVTYPIYFRYSKDIDILRIFQYRCYYSNGIAIDLNPGWNCQSFVGFAVCFLAESEDDTLELHSYRDIVDVEHCTIIVKLSCKDNKNEALQRKCVIVKSTDDYEEDSLWFAYIPFSGLWPAKSNSVTPNDFSRFEVNFMDLEGIAHWGCSLLYERRKRPTSWDDSCKGSTTDIGPLGMLEYLNLSGKKFEHLPEDISLLCRLQYLDISGCRRLRRELPKLPPTIKELYATSYLASESNIVELATKYSKLYSVSFYRPIYPNLCPPSLVPGELAKKFIPITRPFLNRNTPFAVTYLLDSYTDYKISRCFKYPHHDPHHDPHKIFVSLDPSWYSHNFVGFVVCFVIPRKVRWESQPNIRPFMHCELITKLTHKDNGSERPLQTECVIGRLIDEEFNYPGDIVCFVYIPFSSLWPKSKAITNSISPNHYLVFEATIQVDSEISSDWSWYRKNRGWSCDLLYTYDKSLTEAIRQKRESGSTEGDLEGGEEEGEEEDGRSKHTEDSGGDDAIAQDNSNSGKEGEDEEMGDEEGSHQLEQRKKARLDKGKAPII
ncbi:TMV resistance protein N-like isoform X2 [Ipomoea triloba]|uniref:TMV resistance protein N-like isoform X2 n=1 Tax=Ipomoea triloba TaxID=35885 RepID=UPI00125DC425|nr:TMV resistance protein N-like isoform X2 [Ipomoea triloba]